MKKDIKVIEITYFKDGEFKTKEVLRKQEGSKIVWKVKAPKGIITFDRKKDMEKWIRAINGGC